MNYVAQEVVKEFKRLLELVEKFKPREPKLKEAVEKGLHNSRLATKQEEFVHATPIMKNALVLYKDVKQTQGEDGQWVTDKLPVGVKSKAQVALLEMLRAAMIKEIGQECHEYDFNVPFVDKSYYNVDCWNAFDEITEKFWDIVPGQTEQVKKTMQIYSKPKTNLSGRDMLRIMEHDPVMQKTLQIEQKIWPMTKASREIHAISDPFMSKKSGVSYPDYRNDSTLVDPKDPKSMTWGAYEIKLAEEAYSKGDEFFINWALEFAVNTVYMRRQRGKGRALIALSRRTNLAINMVNGVEMENVKNSYYINTPFLKEEEILKELSLTAELALKNGLLPVNIDSKQWDANLGEGLVIAQDAERMILAQGNFTKRLIEMRTAVTAKSWVVDGASNRVYPIFGRMTSGSDDTTLGNTKANRTISTYGALKTNKNYISEVVAPMRYRHVLTVGDDLLVVLKSKEDVEKFIDELVNTFHVVIHKDEKFAYGVMFIQWRVFKYYGKYVMAYNVPRVFRSMCSKEDAKHLGRGGWTFAYWQQLSKLRMFKPALRIVLNIMAAFDQYHLSIDTPVAELIKMVQEEDKIALEKGMTETTAERMYKSNPNIAGLTVTQDGVALDPGYFEQLQRDLKSVYDPNYLKSLGFDNPDLSLVK